MRFLFFIIPVLVVLFDQTTKHLVRNIDPFAALPFLNIVHVWNEGISFGFFQGIPDLPMVIVTATITIGFIVWFFLEKDRRLYIPQMLVIGGAIGNLIDRMLFGAVFDFLDFYIKDWHYPAFNIADCGVVIGIGLITLFTLKSKAS